MKKGVEEPFVLDEVDEDVLDGASSAKFLETVKLRRLRQKVDKLLTQQGHPSKSEQDQTKKAEADPRQKMRQAVRMASEELRKEQGELLNRFSRRQLLRIFIPSAGEN